MPDLVRVPGHGDLVGSPVYNPDRGRGWLGYIEGQLDFFFVPYSLDSRELIGYTEILTVRDRASSEMWMIFVDEKSGEMSAFLIHPEDDHVVFIVPKRVQQLLECL